MKRPTNTATRKLFNYYVLIIAHNNHKLFTSSLLLVCGKRESSPLILSWSLEFV